MEYFVIFSVLLTAGLQIAVSTPIKASQNFPRNTVADAILISSENFGSRRTRNADGSMTNSSMGRCNTTYVSTLSGMCTGLLFKPYRMKTGQSCRSQIPEMTKCVNAVYDICLKGIYTPQQLTLAKATVKSTFSAQAMQKHICDDAGASRVISNELKSVCNSTMTSKYSQCYQNFHQIYDQDRGDPRLCSEFESSTSCLINSLELYCIPKAVEKPIKQAREIMIRKANPFCTIAQGAGDPSTFYSTDSGSNNSARSLGASMFTCFTAFLLAFIIQ